MVDESKVNLNNQEEPNREENTQETAPKPSGGRAVKNFIVSGLGKVGSHSELIKTIFKWVLVVGMFVASVFVFLSHNWFIASIVLVISLIVFKLSKNSFLRTLSLIFIFASLAILASYISSPVIDAFSHKNTPAPWQDTTHDKLARGVHTYNTKFAKLVKSSREYIQHQVDCAEGNCPMGESEGPQVGMMLSTPQLMYAHHVLVGDPLDFSSTLTGINLDLYPDVVVYPFCSVEGETSFEGVNFNVSPKKIYMSDLSNGVVPIMCNAVAIPSTYLMNTIETGVRFNFTTTSDLRLVIMKSTLRNALESVYGTNFLPFVFEINSSQVAYYNDGPINLGMRISQMPLAARAKENSAFLIFALNNQWYSANGAILKINYMNISLPDGLVLIPKKPYCPFVEKGNGVYSLDPSFKLNSPVSSVLSFFCGIKVSKFNSQFPVWTPHIDVSVNYEYELNSSNDIPIYKPDESNRPYSYDGSSSFADQNFSKDCSSLNIDPNNLPPSKYVKQFTSSLYAQQIQRGVEDGASKYGLPGFSKVQMEALLLGIMVMETGVGSNPAADGDGDGIPDHIAGCTGCSSGYNNVYKDIVNAAKALKWNYEDNCKNYSAYPSRLDCALHAYNKGPKADPNDKTNRDIYRPTVKAAMNQWINYLCSSANSGGVSK